VEGGIPGGRCIWYMISCAVGAFPLLTARAWGVVIRERRWIRAGVVGGRICGVVLIEEVRCILAHLTG
jgi:hypothetical protein